MELLLGNINNLEPSNKKAWYPLTTEQRRFQTTMPGHKYWYPISEKEPFSNLFGSQVAINQWAFKADLERLVRAFLNEISIGYSIPGKDLYQVLAEIVRDWPSVKPRLGVEEPMASASNLFKQEITQLGIEGKPLTFIREGRVSLWVVFKTEPDIELKLKVAGVFSKVFDKYPDLKYDFLITTEDELESETKFDL